MQSLNDDLNKLCTYLFLSQVEGRTGLNVMHPRWSPDGKVIFISDETNWWNIYEHSSPNRNLYKKDADFGAPQWKLGCNLFSIAKNGDIAFINEKVGHVNICKVISVGIKYSLRNLFPMHY